MMAERITTIKKIKEPKEYKIEKNIADLKNKLSENKSAIQKGIEILNVLEEAEALDAVHAAITKRKVITEKLVNEINKEHYENILGNLGQMLFLLGDLDLDEASQFVRKINNGMKVANRANPHAKTSITDLLGALKDPEINRSVTMLLHFLKGMSRE